MCMINNMQKFNFKNLILAAKIVYLFICKLKTELT